MSARIILNSTGPGCLSIQGRAAPPMYCPFSSFCLKSLGDSLIKHDIDAQHMHFSSASCGSGPCRPTA